MSYLKIRQVKANEIETQNPVSQWLMALRKNSTCEIIKISSTGIAKVSLAFWFSIVMSVLINLG